MREIESGIYIYIEREGGYKPTKRTRERKGERKWEKESRENHDWSKDKQI